VGSGNGEQAVAGWHKEGEMEGGRGWKRSKSGRGGYRFVADGSKCKTKKGDNGTTRPACRREGKKGGDNEGCVWRLRAARRLKGWSGWRAAHLSSPDTEAS
jgi:hypothetical protein